MDREEAGGLLRRGREGVWIERPDGHSISRPGARLRIVPVTYCVLF
jgi:hypothetical protein